MAEPEHTPPLYAQVADLLIEHNWIGTGDTPATRLREALPKLQALLMPAPLRPGGLAFPVDEGVAHAIAHVAVDGMTGPGRDLAYMKAKAEAGAGMTLRDYMAIHTPMPEDFPESWARALMELAPAAMLPNWQMEPMGNMVWWADAEARYRYIKADAMLRAREWKP